MTQVRLAIPAYGGLDDDLWLRLTTELARPGNPEVSLRTTRLSPISYPCNMMWADALNDRPAVTHFLLLHADVVPEAGFLQKLLEVMRRARADVVSAAVAFRSSQGLTSTSLLPEIDWPLIHPRDYWRRRVTVHELAKLPREFDARALANFWGVSCERPCLLANTGLMLVDLRGAWVERVWFDTHDALYKDRDGKWRADFWPEDWDFTRKAQLEEARVVVTSAVKCNHVGKRAYPNWGEWGAERDEPQ